jgi:hypothetical protein
MLEQHLDWLSGGEPSFEEKLDERIDEELERIRHVKESSRINVFIKSSSKYGSRSSVTVDCNNE